VPRVGEQKLQVLERLCSDTFLELASLLGSVSRSRAEELQIDGRIVLADKLRDGRSAVTEELFLQPGVGEELVDRRSFLPSDGPRRR